MKIETFIRELELDIEHSKKAFIENMRHLGIDDKSFCEWIGTFSAWMEWDENDCEQNHIGYEDEN